MIQRRFLVLVAAVALTAAGCDSGPGPADLTGSAPIVGDLQFSPEVVSSAGTGEFVEALLDVSVQATDADGDLETVFFVVQSPLPGGEPVGTAELAAGAGSTFSTELTLSLPRGLAGAFPVVAFASDAAGRISNQTVASLEVEAGAEPPVITQVDLPDRVVRPAAGEPPVPVQIVAHVDDPDGLDNVLRVETVVNGAVTLLLCDDGGSGTCNPGFGTSGDAQAGDGLFTLTIQIEDSNAPGPNEFVFKAIDRTGLESDTVTRTITLE